jgi:hypothetical protein
MSELVKKWRNKWRKFHFFKSKNRDYTTASFLHSKCLEHMKTQALLGQASRRTAASPCAQNWDWSTVLFTISHTRSVRVTCDFGWAKRVHVLYFCEACVMENNVAKVVKKTQRRQSRVVQKYSQQWEVFESQVRCRTKLGRQNPHFAQSTWTALAFERLGKNESFLTICQKVYVGNHSQPINDNTVEQWNLPRSKIRLF